MMGVAVGGVCPARRQGSSLEQLVRETHEYCLERNSLFVGQDVWGGRGVM